MEPLKPKQNHKAIGEQSEAIIMAKLLEVGYSVLMPFGDNRRYDLVIEDADEKFWRIQCKTGWLENDGDYIEFATASTYYHTRAGRMDHGRRDYRGRSIILPCIVLRRGKCTLFRSTTWGIPAQCFDWSQQRTIIRKNVRWAKDYEL